MPTTRQPVRAGLLLATLVIGWATLPCPAQPPPLNNGAGVNNFGAAKQPGNPFGGANNAVGNNFNGNGGPNLGGNNNGFGGNVWRNNPGPWGTGGLYNAPGRWWRDGQPFPMVTGAGLINPASVWINPNLFNPALNYSAVNPYFGNLFMPSNYVNPFLTPGWNPNFGNNPFGAVPPYSPLQPALGNPFGNPLGNPLANPFANPWNSGPGIGLPN
jgi:hypothetical protein